MMSALFTTLFLADNRLQMCESNFAKTYGVKNERLKQLKVCRVYCVNLPDGLMMYV